MPNKKDIRVVELFAGVGGFRIGLEGASDHYKTIWSNQWEPSTQHQDASIVYQARFGKEGHSNKDINTVINEVPEHDLLVGGFPCQDYSVAASLSRSGGIEGKKGVLWWSIYNILLTQGEKRPNYLFFENVDRLLNSPATQRGRDFAIILASLADLGYVVEWRVINAADYGMPQRRRRTYIVGYKKGCTVARKVEDIYSWVKTEGVMAKAFPFEPKNLKISDFPIEGTIPEVSANFNKGQKESPFGDAGIMVDRNVYSVDTIPVYDGPRQLLGDIIVGKEFVPEEFLISPEELPKWKYEKGAKKIERVSAEGYKYIFSEGGMAFPDPLDKPSRTMITGEGGSSASRFKHVVEYEPGKFRRLVPIELERLNMFPDNHTQHSEVSDGRRAFLMGNALVCGIVQAVGRQLYQFMYDEAPVSSKPIEMKRKPEALLQLSMFDADKPIVVNAPKKTFTPQLSKHLLMGLVKKDNEKYFLDGGQTKLYYTGKTLTFPSTIALNQLYYFMPYIKGKGVKDLYLIKIARIGNKAEVHPETGDTEARLVFELELLKSFDEYKMVSLNILQTFRDTTLGFVMDK